MYVLNSLEGYYSCVLGVTNSSIDMFRAVREFVLRKKFAYDGLSGEEGAEAIDNLPKEYLYHVENLNENLSHGFIEVFHDGSFDDFYVRDLAPPKNYNRCDGCLDYDKADDSEKCRQCMKSDAGW